MMISSVFSYFLLKNLQIFEIAERRTEKMCRVCKIVKSNSAEFQNLRMQDGERQPKKPL